MWTFRCYILGSEDGGFQAWYDLLQPEVQAELDVALEILAATSDWSKSVYYEDLRGACAGLGEIKIDVVVSPTDKRCTRILGFKGPNKREFTLLCWFTKITGSEYAAECPKAFKRKEGVLKDGRRAPVCSFP